MGLAIIAILSGGCNKKEDTELESLLPNPEIGSSDQKLPYYFEEWMKSIDDTLSLSQITIPGTHDSGADKHSSYVSWPIWHHVICQDFKIPNQLRLGVRWFDIRLNYDAWGELVVYHGSFYLSKYFSDVLDWALNFLHNHPSETVILMIKQESTHSSAEEFGQAVYTCIEQKGLDNFFLEFRVPTLKEVRGKIYIVRRFQNKTSHSLGTYAYWQDNTSGSYSFNSGVGFYVQDHYNLHKIATHTKYLDISDCIDTAHAESQSNVFYLNYASGERTPYETLWTTANEINITINNHLKHLPLEWTNCGVILVNFAGGGDSDEDRNCAPNLVKHIISRNHGIPH